MTEEVAAIYVSLLEVREKVVRSIHKAREQEPHNLRLFQHLTCALLFLDDALKHLSEHQP